MYYRNRFACKLTAFGDHNNYEISAAELVKGFSKGTWRIIDGN